MRNLTDVIITDKASGAYLAVGVDRSDEALAQFVRLDLNGATLLMGPGNARKLADLLRKHADAVAP